MKTNPPLIRFLSPIYPNLGEVELTLYRIIGPIRYAVNFLSGGMFTYLNVRYLIAALKPNS